MPPLIRRAAFCGFWGGGGGGMWHRAQLLILAALLLREMGYDGRAPLLDPVCGSGTFVIEAAQLAAGLAPWLLLIAAADLLYGAFLLKLEQWSRAVNERMLLNLAVTYPVNMALQGYVYVFFVFAYAATPAARDALLVLAAFIEAFWSSRELAPQIKYGMGAACWALLALYLLFAGRRQGGRHGPE